MKSLRVCVHLSQHKTIVTSEWCSWSWEDGEMRGWGGGRMRSCEDGELGGWGVGRMGRWEDGKVLGI